MTHEEFFAYCVGRRVFLMPPQVMDVLASRKLGREVMFLVSPPEDTELFDELEKHYEEVYKEKYGAV